MEKNLRSQITALYLQSNSCIMKIGRHIFQVIANRTRRVILFFVALQAMDRDKLFLSLFKSILNGSICFRSNPAAKIIITSILIT
jgi:hypothetical protein